MAARWPVAVFSACIFAFSITSVLLEQPPVSQAVALIAIGGPGQALALGIMVHFIARLAATAARDEQRAAMQQALALCSHELLAHRDEAGIPKALTALLGATEAGYAYVDVNRTDSDGRVTWEIVHSAEGPNNPEGPGEFGKGDYDELPWVVEELGKGCPTQVTVAHLTGSVRQRYEREGIRSELMAPIMIDGNWVGTIGFSDFRRDGAWTELETNALVRAADMIGACWERDRAREGLEELAKAKDRFIAAISHELRTPLSAVVGFSAALASGVNDFSTAEVQEMAEMISRQSRDVSDLVEDLLTSERAASGNLTMCFDWVDLGAEVRAVTELLPEPPQVLPHPPVTVWADGLRVRQVIRNLLTNAGRYGGPQVQVAIDKFERNARLAVIDDGNGVTKVDQDRIFDPYYRSRSDVAVPDSVGLGLAVARQLARLMHGDLVYVRRQGLTRFELILPLAANPQARAGELDEEPRRRSRNRSRAAVIARF
jgi:signal transduction histidine kinase